MASVNKFKRYLTKWIRYADHYDYSCIGAAKALQHRLEANFNRKQYLLSREVRKR